MGLESNETVDDVNAGFLQLTRPEDIASSSSRALVSRRRSLACRCRRRVVTHAPQANRCWCGREFVDGKHACRWRPPDKATTEANDSWMMNGNVARENCRPRTARLNERLHWRHDCGRAGGDNPQSMNLGTILRSSMLGSCTSLCSDAGGLMRNCSNSGRRRQSPAVPRALRRVHSSSIVLSRSSTSSSSISYSLSRDANTG